MAYRVVCMRLKTVFEIIFFGHCTKNCNDNQKKKRKKKKKKEKENWLSRRLSLSPSFPDAASEALPDFGAFLRPDFTSGPRDEAEEEEEASLRGEEEEEEEKGAWRQEATKLVKSSITKVSSTSFVDP